MKKSETVDDEAIKNMSKTQRWFTGDNPPEMEDPEGYKHAKENKSITDQNMKTQKKALRKNREENKKAREALVSKRNKDDAKQK
ncbi:MAG: hypothetical protein LBS57_01310 [Treponema sp.]|nr:hypothetical protein [Treponema sp.]